MSPSLSGPWTVPPGIEINPSIAGVHRRADRYPSPESFRPDRFLGEDAPDGFTWIPFGGGTRRCLGASFALFEMKTVVTRVLERTSLEPVGSPTPACAAASPSCPAMGSGSVRRWRASAPGR